VYQLSFVLCSNTVIIFDDLIFRPDHLLFYVEKGELVQAVPEHSEAAQKAYKVKMEQSKQVAQKLFQVSEAIQKSLEHRSVKNQARGRTPKKRVFAETAADSGSQADSVANGDTTVVTLDSSVASAAKQAKGDSLDISNPEDFVGRKVAKFFGEYLFLGEVTEYLPPENESPSIWTVVYNDGDQEDYELKELLELVELHRQYDRRELDLVHHEDEDNEESNGV